MRPSSTARRYADAAFQIAQSDGNAGTWLQHLKDAAETVSRTDVASYFRDPKISTDEKEQTVTRLFPNLPQHLQNLLRLLVVRQRIYLLPSIAREFEALDREARGVTEAYVTVARPLTDQERAEISARLGRATGKTVELHARIDPTILGGIVIRIGDQLVDASVAGRLQRLRQELAV
jgi:F-type H+-transporting ATPase subunit delta